MLHRILLLFELEVWAGARRQTYVPHVRAQLRVIREANVIPARRDDGRLFQIVVVAEDEGIDSLALGVLDALL